MVEKRADFKLMRCKNRKILYCICIAVTVLFICCFFTIRNVADNKKIQYYNDFVKIIEDKDGMALVSGQNKSGNYFQIALNYAKTDVILKNAYLMPFANNNQQKLCLEMNIFNTVSPDLNTIIICDMDQGKILFPTPDITFIYDGSIEQVEIGQNTKTVIRYNSYTKINGTTIEDENSIVGWNGNSFETLEYRNKLLLETDEYIAFYKKVLDAKTNSFELLILDPLTLQAIQEINLRTNEVNITSKIKDHGFIVRTSGSYDLYVEGYGKLYWDKTLRKFN